MVYVDTSLFKRTLPSPTPAARPTVPQAVAPIKTASVSTGSSKKKSFWTKAMETINAPQAFVQKYLAPTIFGKGVSSYEQGLKNLGWSPTAATIGAIAGETVLDPLNLLAIGPVGKLATAPLRLGGKLASKAIKPVLGLEKVQKFAKPASRLVGEVANFAVKPAERLFRGTKSGEQLLTKLREVEEGTKSFSGPLLQRFDEITRHVPDEVFKEALNFREGFIPKASPAARLVAKQLDEVFEPIAKKSTGLLEIRNPFTKEAVPWVAKKGYVPHSLDLGAIKKNPDVVIDHMVKTGQMAEDKAKTFVKALVSDDPIDQAFIRTFQPKDAPKLYGALEYMRVLDFPPEVLRRGKDVVSDYIYQSSKRITTAEKFGASNQELTRLLTGVSSETPQAKKIQDIAYRTLGMETRDVPGEELFRAARTYQGATKLGTASVSNVSQSVNTAAVTGTLNTARNFLKEFISGAGQRKFAVKSGALSGFESGKITEEAMGTANRIIRSVGAPFFSKTEQMNRSIAANAGKDFAKQLFQKTLRGDMEAGRKLTEMGIDVQKASKRGRLLISDLNKAARNIVKRTQFTTSPLDLPYGFSTPAGKVLTQFKNFAYKQGEFVINELFGPAIERGDFVPLVRYKLLGTAAGEITGDVKAYITGRRRPKTVQERKIENLMNVGGAGIIGDLINATKFGKEGILEWLAGPSVSEAAKLISGTGALARGEGGKEIFQTLLRDIPVAGPRLKRTIYPSGVEKKKGIPPLIPQNLLPRW